MKIHSGNLSYLNTVHRKYGRSNYYMVMIKIWSNGKYTVGFKQKEQ